MLAERSIIQGVWLFTWNVDLLNWSANNFGDEMFALDSETSVDDQPIHLRARVAIKSSNSQQFLQNFLFVNCVSAVGRGEKNKPKNYHPFRKPDIGIVHDCTFCSSVKCTSDLHFLKGNSNLLNW